MRSNPDTGFITGVVLEKPGDLKSTDLRGVRMRIAGFEDEVEETWEKNSLIEELKPGNEATIYLNPRYGGRYDEVAVGDQVKVHVALIGATGGNYLIGDRTEIKDRPSNT